ncbi:NACHT domain-containing protein [Planomonospora alba]
MPLTETGRRRWRIVLTLVLLVIGCALVAVLGRSMVDLDEDLSLADFLGIPGAVLAAGTALAGVLRWVFRRPPPPPAPSGADIAEAKAALADLVDRQWTEEACFRSLCDPGPIPVAWHLTGRRVLMDHPHMIVQGRPPLGGRADDIRGLAEEFRRLRHRRLVIAGGPGMGKTTLAVQLLLELVRTRADDEPVPVLLSVAGWDTGRHRRLHEWLAVRLAADYPALRAAEYGGDGVPAALVRQGHVLPVLDGLDELPAPARSQVVMALNGSLAERDQVVLTSRTAEYAAAVRDAGDVLTGAAVVVPAVLTPGAAADYLRECLPPEPRHDWTAVLEALRSGAAPALAAVAASPLGLWLVRMVYTVPGADPAPLTGAFGDDAGRLRAHLLDRLVETFLRARPSAPDRAAPFRPRREWNPGQARAWLGNLADLLNRNGTRDLAWWTIARYAAPPAARRRLQLAAGFVAAAVVGLGFLPVQLYPPQGVIPIMAGFAIVIGIRAGRWFREAPGFADRRIGRLFRIPLRGLALGFAVWAGTALVCGLLIWFGEGAGSGPVSNLLMVAAVTVLLGGYLAGVAAVLIAWIRRVERPTPVVSVTAPSSAWVHDRNLAFFRALMAGSVCGLVPGVLTGLASREEPLETVVGMVYGLCMGGLPGLVAGVAIGRHHAWLACRLVLLWLAPTGFLPSRLIPFLDDMHRLGLLRTVGPLYQFRHAELQDHLAARACPPRGDAGAGAPAPARGGRRAGARAPAAG